MINRQLIIYILFILGIITTTQSKNIFYKSAKENFKLQPNMQSTGNSTNVTQIVSTSQTESSSSQSFLKKSFARKLLSCMTKQFNIVKCMKIYILQKLEASNTNENLSRNVSVTADFFNRIVSDTNDDDHVLNDFYYKLTDKELHKRMYLGFKEFFGEREINIQLTPGITIKVVSTENDLMDLSVRKELLDKPAADGVLSSRGRKNKYFHYMMKMGVPAMFLPIALIGSFLPMILPGIKMATLFTGAVNNAALVAALMYLARTAALENEHKNTVYYTSGSLH